MPKDVSQPFKAVKEIARGEAGIIEELAKITESSGTRIRQNYGCRIFYDLKKTVSRDYLM